jgi:hypothetical protein
MHDPRQADPPQVTLAAAGDRKAETFGETIAHHLFSAGLDLNYALMFFERGEPGRNRLLHAIDEIDAAIASLRHLVVEAGKADLA